MSNKQIKQYSMNKTQAADTLNNILAACDRDPITVSLDKIKTKNMINLHFDDFFIALSALLLVLTLLLPVFYPHSTKAVFVDESATHQLSITEHHWAEGCIYVTFEGDVIDVKNSYMLDEFDNRIDVLSYDKESNCVVFPFVSGEYNITITAEEGDVMHLLLSGK